MKIAVVEMFGITLNTEKLLNYMESINGIIPRINNLKNAKKICTYIESLINHKLLIISVKPIFTLNDKVTFICHYHKKYVKTYIREERLPTYNPPYSRISLISGEMLKFRQHLLTIEDEKLYNCLCDDFGYKSIIDIMATHKGRKL